MRLQDLDDDILIQLFTLLPVASILILRQTCTHFSQISRLRFVWQNVCRTQVLSHGYPFQCRRLARADAPELERLVRHALRLAAFWSTPSDAPRRSVDFQASTGTGVSHVRLLPGRGGRYLLTVYKGIWSMISCWDLGSVPSAPTTPTVTKVADWCPRNTIFSGFVVNTEPDSDAALAVAVQHGGGSQSIELLTIFPGDGDGDDGEPPAFKSVCNIATGFHPVALRGDLIAFSDDASETVVMNWRKNTFALLKSSQRPVDEHFQYNRCLQVVFAHRSILIVRARSVELFPEPELRPADGEYVTYSPVGFHTFGWIDGVAVVPQCGTTVDANDVVKASGHEPLSILLRAESDDPWASDVHTLEQFVLHPNPAFDNTPNSNSNSNSESPPPSSLPDGSSQPEDPDVQPTSALAPASAPAPVPPYLFPPVRAEHTSPTVRGFLRCRDIVLGPSGTALWIQPRAARTAHLTGYDVHASSAPVDEALDPDRLRPLSPSPSPGPSPGHGHGHAHARTAESLCAAVFEGPLQRRCAEVGMRMGMGMGMGMRTGPAARTLWAQTREGCNWTAFDYDEETGRVALGSSDGSVTVLDLV